MSLALVPRFDEAQKACVVWEWCSSIRERAKRASNVSQKNATHRAARPDPSLRKERLLRMTIELHHSPFVCILAAESLQTLIIKVLRVKADDLLEAGCGERKI